MNSDSTLNDTDNSNTKIAAPLFFSRTLWFPNHVNLEKYLTTKEGEWAVDSVRSGVQIQPRLSVFSMLSSEK